MDRTVSEVIAMVLILWLNLVELCYNRIPNNSAVRVEQLVTETVLHPVNNDYLPIIQQHR